MKQAAVTGLLRGKALGGDELDFKIGMIGKGRLIDVREVVAAPQEEEFLFGGRHRGVSLPCLEGVSIRRLIDAL